MKESSKTTIGALVIVAVSTVLAIVFWKGIDDFVPAFGGAQSGMAYHASSSLVGVGPQEDKTLFSENRDCASRVITTSSSTLVLSFHSNVNPTAGQFALGHQQAASTTSSYDSDIYGCGTVTAAAYSSTTITRTEFSQ